MSQLILSMIVMLAILAFLVFAVVGLVKQTKRRREVTDRYDRILISRFSGIQDVEPYGPCPRLKTGKRSFGAKSGDHGSDLSSLFYVPARSSDERGNSCLPEIKYDISDLTSKEYTIDYFYVPRSKGCDGVPADGDSGRRPETSSENR